MESSDLIRRDSHESVYGNLFKDPTKSAPLRTLASEHLGLRMKLVK